MDSSCCSLRRARSRSSEQKLRAETDPAAALAEGDHRVGVIRPGTDADRRADGAQRGLRGKAGDILRAAAEHEGTVPEDRVILFADGPRALLRRQAVRLQQGLLLLPDGLGVAQEGAARVGQLQRRAADDELRTQLLLHGGDMAGERLLRDMQGLGRAGKAALAGEN